MCVETMSYKIDNLVKRLPRKISGGTILTSDLAVLRAIADRADDGGWAFNSVRDISELSNCPRATANRALDRLIDLKLITKDPQMLEDSHGRTSSWFRIQVDVIAEHVAEHMAKQSARKQKAWRKSIEWLVDWTGERINERDLPSRPYAPKTIKTLSHGETTPLSHHEATPLSHGETYEQVIGEPVILEPSTGAYAPSTKSRAAAPADAGLPSNDEDQVFVVHTSSATAEVRGFGGQPPVRTEGSIDHNEKIKDGLEEEIDEGRVEEASPDRARGGSSSDLWTTPSIDPWQRLKDRQPAYFEEPAATPSDGFEDPSASTSEPVSLPFISEGSVWTGLSAFLEVFPRRQVDRRSTDEAWKAARRRGVPAELMIEAARRYAEAVADLDPRMVKRPPAWLNRESYLEFEVPAEMAAAA